MQPARRQLPLPFPHEPAYEPHSFVPAESNQAARAWLSRQQDWPDRRLALFGVAGSGKTHLLRLWAGETGATRLDGRLPVSLDALPETGAVAVDDADLVTPEQTLLHLLNTARDRGLLVLLAARQAPSRWPVTLPDLSSRLRAITAVEIQPPEDALLRMLFDILLAERQLVVPDTVRTWLLRRLPRSPAALREAAARLDRLSLADGKPVTRGLASRLLADGDSWEDQEDSVTSGCFSSRTIGLL